MNNSIDRNLISNLNLEKRNKHSMYREEINKKLYLGEIVDIEKPEFASNNLILAPVGSGKSFLIEEKLIPKGFKGKILYLASNSSLKDSLAPDNNKLRKYYAANGKSKGFFTSKNKNRYGDVPYSVHVMTYHEFSWRIYSPNETFSDQFDLVFCDEIHSLPIFTKYGGNGELLIALRWLFDKHKDKTLYYFTATMEGLDNLEKRSPGYLTGIKIFNYLDHPNIMKYQARSTYYISNTHQLRVHLAAKVDYVKYNNKKGLAFTSRISSQEKIAELAREEGYTPIILWSINNKDTKLSKEQLRVRDFILEVGNIPEPYNLLIINGSMQEGWNLYDKSVEFAILDTLDETERIQALGRIRKDIDFLLLKVESEDKKANAVIIKDEYLNSQLTVEDKDKLLEELNILNKKGELIKWPTASKIIENSGYSIENSVRVVDGRRRRVSIIKNEEFPG